ncbi:nucleoporin NUP188 homolog isoform X1 [Rousettus aegyptiacus]|uniref:Nucleoporin NUP188 n=1 Tax=Rousettus aegyptiacus TaxID=9407 RepID=A0A7J8INY1_ROUAE|nr:nucleoporin NUP188 homolog isoform X1 [Rousettus aegyptiacus]KAF6486303.1 nucleoporin 188 [Rousettus aegyptiacus]
MAAAAGGPCVRSSRELWTILLGRSALRELNQIEAELNKHWQRLLEGLSYYKPPSPNSAEKVKANKDVASPLKELGLRISKFLSLDEEQSVQLLQCYLQEDYRGTRDSLKTVLQDERQSQALILKIADYYYEERTYILRCVLHLLTYFQDERHPYRVEYADCVDKLEKELVIKYRQQFEELYKTEAPTWETHGNLMTERQVSRWFVQCLREQSMLLEIIFLYFAYFEMAPSDLLVLTKMFKEQGFGSRQTNRHLVDETMDPFVDRIGYFSALILVEGMDIESLHKCALDDRRELHQFAQDGLICQGMDRLMMTFGDIPHHAPVLLAWALLRHTLNPEETSSIVRKIGGMAIQLNVFQYLTRLLRSLASGGNDCTTSTACMCVYGLLSFVLTSLELHTLGNQQDVIDTACEVLADPSLPELFWGTEPTSGLGIILDSVCGMFPHLLSPLLQLLRALVSGKSTAKKVYSFLDKMSFYNELYKHKPHDVISHEDGTLWRRQTPKLLYPLGGQTNLRIPQGTVGQVMLDDRAYLVRWEYSYSSWTLFTCEIEMLLHVVSTADVIQHCQRVKPIIDLVHKVISTDLSIADCLLPITSRIYMLLQRLTTVISPPVDVIASCVNCLTVLAARNPAKVWTDLRHTGFLPFVAHQVSSMSQMISAEGMNAGGYGNLLMNSEQPQGEYGVTVAFLRLITTLVKGQLGSTQSQGLAPCVMFVMKEMLPSYHKWRYTSHGVREQIGCLILELIHAILNLCHETDLHSSHTPSLQSLCICSLAYTEAGQTVINIMGIGVDTIDMVMAAQPRSDGAEGQGQGPLLIKTVKLAFSVSNNVIRLKPPSNVVSPLEQALTQHGAHGNNLIAVLAKYIYHKHDPALPRLAIQLLKRLATVAPMSVYACLGNDAAAIRDAFLTRLQSKIEDMRIKVMILEFLTVAVETQPGLIELFLNLEVKDGSDGSKEFSLGVWSCLHVVLELIDSQQQDRYWCPPLLHRAAIAFLHALWQDRRDSAMLVLRTKPKFWENLTSPLFGTLSPPSETSEPSILETCALIMKIICLEIYYVVKGSLDQSLKDTLKKFSSEKRFAYWSGYVKSLAVHTADTEGSSCTAWVEYQMLVSAWRMLLIIATSHAEIMHLTDVAVRRQLFLDALDGTKALLLVPASVNCLRLGSMMCTLLLILLRQWKRELSPVDEILGPLTEILEGVLQADRQLMEKTKAKVFSAFITVLQMKEMRVSDIPQYSQLVLNVCETLQEEVIALFDQTRHSLASGSATEDKDSMETDDCSRPRHKDQRDGQVCVLGLHLAKELCEVDEDGDSWLQVTRRLPILPTLFTTLEVSLRMKQNLHFTEAALHLLLTLARTQQGATAVAGAGITQSICLPLLSVYQLSTNGMVQTSTTSRKSLDAPSWPGVYRLSMSLMERLLKTLRYNFLTEALDFVGVHQERTLQCLNAVRTVQSLACLEEADHTVGFILQLSSFMKEWHFHLPQLMRDVQVNLGYLCQACASLLHSRAMLQHRLQSKNGDGIPSAIAPRVSRPPTAVPAAASCSSSKQPTADTEASEQRALHMVQYGLLKILSRTLAALRHFTPDVCQILLDQSLDLAEYNFLFALSFTTPTFDSEVAPSFGTLLATVNVALNMLGELDKKKEPLTQAVGLSTQAEGPRTLKSLLMFTMENCFYLLISQAMRYLRDPAVHPRDKQRMKQELSSELSTLLSSLSRYFRRGAPSSPAAGVLPSPQGKSTSLSKASPESQEPLIQLVQAFVRHVQR